MFDLADMIQFTFLAVDEKARAEGHTATEADYKAEIDRVWDAWLEACVTRDMTAAGFVKTATGWEKPKRSFWAWLLG